MRKPPCIRHTRSIVSMSAIRSCQQAQRLETERAVAAVDQKPRPVARPDDRLAHRLARRVGERECALRRLRAGHDLQQAHDRRGVEEVHPHHPLGHRHRRGAIAVTSNEEVLVASTHPSPTISDSVAVQLVLELQALGRRLDHELAGSERSQVVHGPQAIGRVPRVRGGGAAARGFFLKARSCALDPALERLPHRGRTAASPRPSDRPAGRCPRPSCPHPPLR